MRTDRARRRSSEGRPQQSEVEVHSQPSGRQIREERVLNTEFDNEATVDHLAMADAFDLEYAERVLKPGDLTDTFANALDHNGPAMVVVIV